MGTPGGAARTGDGNARSRRGEQSQCDLYVPGHLVHYIQARKEWGSDDPVSWGRFESVEDGCLVVRYLDRIERYRVHRPAEIEQVAEPGDKVRVSERWRIATISRRFEGLLTVCIARADDPWRPCRVAAKKPRSVGDLAAPVTDRGAFMASGRRIAPFVRPGPGGGDGPPPDGDLGEVS